MVACLCLAVVSWGQAVQGAPLFEDRSAGLPEHIYTGGWEHFVGGGLAVFDCNQDGLPDIYAAGGSNPAQLLINQGSFAFQDIEIEPLTGVTGAYPIDMDGDGISDLFVMRVGANVALKGGPECSFSDATAQWGLPADKGWTTAFTAWWEGDQSRPTLAIGNYVDRDDPKGPFEACDSNMILRPTEDAYTAAPLQPGYCPLSMLAARDARGRATLRLSNDRQYYVKDGHEQMWDLTEARFLTEADGWPRLALWGAGIASRDLTEDGLDEVALTSWGPQVLQIAGADGTYHAAPAEVGASAQRPHTGGDGRPSTGWHAEFGDIDNDGLADLFITKGNVDQMPGMATRDPNTLLMQYSDGSFHEAAQSAGLATMARSRGAALADFDADGLLDIAVMNRRAPMELYRNVSTDTGTWLKVALSQPGGNRDAIGAQITVTTEFGTQTIQHVIGGGHAGGQLLARHFGLGVAEAAELTVRWPDGTQTQGRVGAGQTYLISKP